jgi:hypothetical protein
MERIQPLLRRKKAPPEEGGQYSAPLPQDKSPVWPGTTLLLYILDHFATLGLAENLQINLLLSYRRNQSP